MNPAGAVAESAVIVAVFGRRRDGSYDQASNEASGKGSLFCFLKYRTCTLFLVFRDRQHLR